MLAGSPDYLGHGSYMKPEAPTGALLTITFQAAGIGLGNTALPDIGFHPALWTKRGQGSHTRKPLPSSQFYPIVCSHGPWSSEHHWLALKMEVGRVLFPHYLFIKIGHVSVLYRHTCCEKNTIVELITIPSYSRFLCVLRVWWEHLNRYSLSNFPVCNIVLYTLVIMLYIRSLEFILRNCFSTLWPTTSLSPTAPTPGNDCSTLSFYELDIF